MTEKWGGGVSFLPLFLVLPFLQPPLTTTLEVILHYVRSQVKTFVNSKMTDQCSLVQTILPRLQRFLSFYYHNVYGLRSQGG